MCAGILASGLKLSNRADSLWYGLHLVQCAGPQPKCGSGRTSCRCVCAALLQINAGIVKNLVEACGKHCPGVSGLQF